jgi:type I restriction enzyme R subunit
MNLSKLKELISKDTNEQNINEQGRFDELIRTLDKIKAVEFLKKVTGQEIKNRYIITGTSSIVRRFILDPSDRTKIIYAYQNDGLFLDVNIPDELPETETEKSQQQEDNKLPLEEIKSNLIKLTKDDLSTIFSDEAMDNIVNMLFNIINKETLPSVDGVGLDLYKAIDELLGRKKVSIVDKHVNSGNLSVKFEVFLKKVYYILNNKEIEPSEEGKEVTLPTCIFAFPCLRSLKYGKLELEQKLYNYQILLRKTRNTSDGNGAHASCLLAEEQLDKNIKSFMTLYLYVIGMNIERLKVVI